MISRHVALLASATAIVSYLVWVWKLNLVVLEKTGLQPDQKASLIGGVHGNSHEKVADIHLVFSTGCSHFQDWQSYAFFFHAKKVQPAAQVTRVASGCSDETAKTLRNYHEEYIQSMSSNFRLHLTPEYSNAVPGVDYKFFNKPMGLRHWMERGLGFADHRSDALNRTVFVILDPDQFLVRPFLSDYTNEQDIWKDGSTFPSIRKIEAGKPMAQVYGFGAHWVPQLKPDELIGKDQPSPLRTLSTETVLNHYAAGPPYAAVGSDMYRIVRTWAELVVPVYHQTKDHLSEMFAYSTAAAHLDLKHQLAVSWMVSSVDMGRDMEPWGWVDSQPPLHVCPEDKQRPQHLPRVIHYCQRYFAGPYFFSKYQVPKIPDHPQNFLSCEHPLYEEPPPEIVHSNKSQTLDGTWHTLSPVQAKRNAFMLCRTLPRMNEMALYYKQQHCDPKSEFYNIGKTFRHKLHSEGNE